jgi:hypothetical protein
MMTDFADRKARWCAFYDRAPEVPFVIHVNYSPDVPPRPLPHPALVSERIEWAWQQYQRWMDRAAWLHDDFIPSLDSYTGTEIFAEAFGCPVHRPEDNMPFALPIITRAEQVDDLAVPEVMSSSLAALFEIADELKSRAGAGALMRMIDIQSPMDIAALIWDKNTFYTAMIETPEAVQALAGKVRALLTAFLDAWFARYGREFIAHFPYYYMPRGMTLSEDEVGAVNTRMFDELFLPELVELSERYGGIGIHCCADSAHQWPGFKRIPGLRMLNICQPPDVVRAAYTTFAPVCGQYHWSVWDGPAWTWPAQWPAGARVVVDVGAETQEQALELAEKLTETRQRLAGSTV